MQELGHKKYANRELNSLFAYNSYSIYASVRSEFCQILRTKCNFSALSMQNLTSFAVFLSKYLHMSKFYSNFATNFEEKIHGIY